MKRRIAAQLIGAFTLSPAFAATSPARVVVGIEKIAGIEPSQLERLTSKVIGGLIQSDRFVIVDRARVEALKREQGFANSSYADPKTAAAFGKILGAQYILAITSATLEAEDEKGAFVSSHRIHGEASFQLLEVATARVALSGTAEGDAQKRAVPGSPFSKTQLEREALDQVADDVCRQVLTLK